MSCNFIMDPQISKQSYSLKSLRRNEELADEINRKFRVKFYGKKSVSQKASDYKIIKAPVAPKTYQPKPPSETLLLKLRDLEILARYNTNFANKSTPSPFGLYFSKRNLEKQAMHQIRKREGIEANGSNPETQLIKSDKQLLLRFNSIEKAKKYTTQKKGMFSLSLETDLNPDYPAVCKEQLTNLVKTMIREQKLERELKEQLSLGLQSDADKEGQNGEKLPPRKPVRDCRNISDILISCARYERKYAESKR